MAIHLQEVHCIQAFLEMNWPTEDSKVMAIGVNNNVIIVITDTKMKQLDKRPIFYIQMYGDIAILKTNMSQM